MRHCESQELKHPIKFKERKNNLKKPFKKIKVNFLVKITSFLVSPKPYFWRVVQNCIT